MSPKSVSVDEKTKIPLFATLGVIPTLVGGIIWLTNIDAKASAAHAELQDTKIMLRQALEQLNNINARLSRIEGWVSK